MNRQDREQVRVWIQSGATLAEVEAARPFGAVGNIRFTERARRLYVTLWTWGAGRYSGRAGMRQDRAYAWGGHLFLHNRKVRCLHIVQSLLA